jgi:hypothetical protein
LAVDFLLRRFVNKIFKSTDNAGTEGVYNFMGLKKPSVSAHVREETFLYKFEVISNRIKTLFPSAKL